MSYSLAEEYDSILLEQQHLGELPVWRDGSTGKEYAVAWDFSHIYYGVKAYLSDNIWELDAEFIADFIPAYDNVSDTAKEHLAKGILSLILEQGYNCNSDLSLLVDYNFESMVYSAIENFGAANFLDTNEGIELTANDFYSSNTDLIEAITATHDIEHISDIRLYRVD